MRRILSQSIFWLSLLVTFVSGGAVAYYWASSDFQYSLIEAGGGEQTFYYIAVGQAIAIMLAYFLSLDSHATRRPWIAMIAGAFSPGATAGLTGIAFTYEQVDLVAVGGALGGGVASAAAILIFEFFNRWLWHFILCKLDKKHLGGPALMASRLALLWKPGQEELLGSVSIEMFRRGRRGEVGEQLRRMYQQGIREPELLELLCQLAAEEKKPDEFICYLGELFNQFPEDQQLRDAYLDELLELGKNKEALAHIDAHGLRQDEDLLEKHAILLLEAKRLLEAVKVAQRLGDLEGVPMRRSDAILRKVLSVDDKFVPAMNVLADQADRQGRKDQQIRWLDRSVTLDRTQTDRMKKLADLLEGADMHRRLEELLFDMLIDRPHDMDLGLRHASLVYSNGKIGDAIEALDKLETRGCNKAEMYLMMAKANFELDKLDEAKNAAEKALTKQLTEEQSASMNALVRRIERAVFSAELAQKLEDCEAQPENLELQLETLSKLCSTGHFDRAIGHADLLLRHHQRARGKVIAIIEHTFINLKDGGFTLLNYLADLQVAEGRFDDALETVKMMAKRSLSPAKAIKDGAQKILRRSPHHLNTLRVMGEMYEEIGQFTEMIHSYSLYLANGGEENVVIDQSLAKAYMAINDFPSARRFVNSLLDAQDADPEENARLLHQIIPLALESNNAMEAAEYIKRLELILPEDRETRVLRGRVDASLGEQRFSFLQRELEAGKGDANTLEELGDLSLEREDYHQAITYYQRASRQKGATRVPAAKLAYCFAKKRMFDLAGETLMEIKLSLSDDSEELDVLMRWIYKTAEALEGAHMFEKASRLFKQLMKIDAGYRDVLQRVEKLNKM